MQVCVFVCGKGTCGWVLVIRLCLEGNMALDPGSDERLLGRRAALQAGCTPQPPGLHVQCSMCHQTPPHTHHAHPPTQPPADFVSIRKAAREIMQKEDDLNEIVQLVGKVRQPCCAAAAPAE